MYLITRHKRDYFKLVKCCDFSPAINTFPCNHISQSTFLTHMVIPTHSLGLINYTQFKYIILNIYRHLIPEREY